MCSPRPAPSPIKSVRLYYIFGQPTVIEVYMYKYTYTHNIYTCIYRTSVPSTYTGHCEYALYIPILDALLCVLITICRLTTFYIFKNNKRYIQIRIHAIRYLINMAIILYYILCYILNAQEAKIGRQFILKSVL